jgi:streptogramin lyase
MPHCAQIVGLRGRRSLKGSAGAIVVGLAILGFAYPLAAQTVTEFGTVPVSNVNGGGLPLGIVTGPDGNLWFTQNNGRIGQITPKGLVTIFSGGINVGAQSVAIAVGSDGNLWFTENRVDNIGKITPAGLVTEIPITPGASPSGICLGPDGNLWFTENLRASIGRMTPDGTLTEFSAGIVPGSQPVGITAGPDGNLWFTEFSSAKIGRITPGGVITEFSAGLVSGQLPYAITAGADGNLWFTDVGLNQIGRITTAGTITMFSSGISTGALPGGITPGPDGNLWFTEQGTGLVGRITPAGVITEFSTGITPNSEPLGITAGPDGNLWFAEYATSLIGRISTGSLIPQAGFWWNPAEPGRGYTIEQRGGNLFMAAFLYDKSGRATWYGVGPGALDGATYTGTLTSYANGQTLTGAYQSPTVIGPSGFFSITFTSPTQATMYWPGGTEALQRYYFGSFGSAPVQAAGAPQAGWWYAPSEGGRGYAIEVQGSTMFLAGYMYDSFGNPIWYSSGPGATIGASVYGGVWQQFGNGQTLTDVLYYAPVVANVDVGNVTLQFTSPTTGMLTLPNGRQVAIQRYLF